MSENIKFRYFNQWEWEKAISERHAKIAANPIHKVLTHPYFERLYIIPEIEKQPDGKGVDVETGEEIKTKDYFEVGYEPVSTNRKNNTLPFAPDGVTEFSQRWKALYFLYEMELLFSEYLMIVADLCKAEKTDFICFWGKSGQGQFKAKDSHLSKKVDVLYDWYLNDDIYIFSLKVDAYDWQYYFDFEDCFHTILIKIPLADLDTFFNF